MLGMGSFGMALARKLAANGCHVIGVDAERDRLEAVKNEIQECVIGDATDREVLENLPLRDASAVFISLGETISESLLATLHCKELGARQVIVKGVTKEHGKILEHLGVDRVVFPEEEVARHTTLEYRCVANCRMAAVTNSQECMQSSWCFGEVSFLKRLALLLVLYCFFCCTMQGLKN